MPRKMLMSWDGNRARWTKMYKGQRYLVTCFALGVPGTMQASYQAANNWWEAKKAEIDGYTPAPKDTAAQQALLEGWTGGPLTPEKLATAVLMTYLQDKEMPPQVRQLLVEPAQVGQILTGLESLHDAAALPAEKTIGKLVDTYTDLEMQRHRAGKVGLARLNMNRLCLHHFRDWCGSHQPVEYITEQTWIEFYGYLSAKIKAGEWGVSHCDRIFAVARRFVKFLWEMRLVELPRNLDSRVLSFANGAREIEVWPVESIHKLYGIMTGQSRLHLLLMLNCGFIGQDISDLSPSEVDWQAGIISRKRSKTRHEAGVPMVRYKLWKPTLKLLREYRSDDPERVLLTTTGRPWIEEQHDGDKYHRSDKVASCLKYWMRRAGIQHSPKALRATAASTLARHPQFKFYGQYFLGHSPRSVADKHYMKPSDDEFFAALEWLAGELGF